MNFRRGSAAVRLQRTGGAGHTTETLRQRVHAEYQAIETANPAFASRQTRTPPLLHTMLQRGIFYGSFSKRH